MWCSCSPKYCAEHWVRAGAVDFREDIKVIRFVFPEETLIFQEIESSPKAVITHDGGDLCLNQLV